MSATHIFLLFLSIFFIDVAHSAISSSNTRCIKSEWTALMEFKGSLVSDSSSLSSWNGRDCCSWDEITCDNLTGHVQSLVLDPRHNFNSTLSPWLFNLSRLEVLSVSSCGFLGTIPNMFGRLTSLSSLSLSGNSFSSVFPDSLCLLTNLVEMDLSISQLQGSLPVCLGNMTSLTMLYMGFNELSGEIPGELGNLPSITTIDLSNNLFNSSIPPTFGNLTQLEYLDVSHNSLIGELSESFFEGLKSLRGLVISGNQFLVFNVSSQWIPPFQFRYFEMDSVFFGTQFPPWIKTKRDLKVLTMSNASISGVIPSWCLTVFPNITHFDLSRNLLTGPLPTFDANKSAFLTELLFSDNQITGNIPGELCNLKSLQTLSLANNKLTGRIPLCLGNLQKLEILDLGNNQIFGHVPSELGSLGNLNLLYLNGNKLFGELSSSLQNLNSLITLDLGDNELQGCIPEWIGIEWSRLQYLRLESNNFSSQISANLCQLPSLHILNLAHNNLIGIIPPCLGNLSEMLSNETGSSAFTYTYTETLSNHIKGTQMEYSSNLRYAKFITLSSNHLNGEIPAELMNLNGLQSLNLSMNELTGRIPEKIDSLQNLESLDLSMNRLSGTIPQSLAHIDALSYLNISFNNLSGKIPSGNHFNTFTDPSIYEGNEGLCGELLKKSCLGDDFGASNKQSGAVSDDSDDDPWIYAGIGPGFAVGFVGVICILYFKHSWRIAYFGFVDNVYNRVWVTLAIKISRIKRKLISEL